MRTSALRVALGVAVLAAVFVPTPAQADGLEYASTTPVPLVDGTGGDCVTSTPQSVTSTITVPDVFEVGDLDVDLDIAHTYRGDVTVTLTSPEGTTITLVDRIGFTGGNCGSSSADIVTLLDDAAGTSVASYPGGGSTHAPIDPLSDFAGEGAAGDWILTVTDSSSMDSGTLRAWSLIFEAGPATFSVDDATAGEGDAEMTFTVTRSSSLVGTDTVDYATVDGTATAGADYTATSGTLTFTPGVETLEVTVPILDDSLVEGDETFTLQLTDPTGNPTPTITTAEATGTIVDDAEEDEEPTPTTPTTGAPTTTTTAPTTTAPVVPAAPRAQAVTTQPTYVG